MSKKKFLIVVDMQRDFIDGSLGTKEAQGIVPRVIQRIQEAHQDGYIIAYTQDTHYKNYLDTPEGKRLPVPHCIYGTEGWEIPKEILEASGTPFPTVYVKETFGSIDLCGELGWLIDEGEDADIEVIGLCTDICVVSNALLLKAYFPEANISVNASCCAGVTPELHEAALKVMASCQINIL